MSDSTEADISETTSTSTSTSTDTVMDDAPATNPFQESLNSDNVDEQDTFDGDEVNPAQAIIII
jgi:hypothetical protein